MFYQYTQQPMKHFVEHVRLVRRHEGKTMLQGQNFSYFCFFQAANLVDLNWYQGGETMSENGDFSWTEQSFVFCKDNEKEVYVSNLWPFVSFVRLTLTNKSHSLFFRVNSLHLACKVTGRDVFTHHSLVKHIERWRATSLFLPLSSAPESLGLIFVGAKRLLTRWRDLVAEHCATVAWWLSQMAAEEVWRCFASSFMVSTSRQRRRNINRYVPATHFYLPSSVPGLYLRWRVKAGKLKSRWAVELWLPVTLWASTESLEPRGKQLKLSQCNEEKQSAGVAKE